MSALQRAMDRWAVIDEAVAQTEGWDLFMQDGRPMLQRIDDPQGLGLDYSGPKFDSDAEVWIHVRRRANNPAAGIDTHCTHALALLHEHGYMSHYREVLETNLDTATTEED